jgi:thiamine-monophosphate kinase
MKTNVYRNGAKQTDLLVVTGDSAAYMGLQVLERESKFFR